MPKRSRSGEVSIKQCRPLDHRHIVVAYRPREIGRVEGDARNALDEGVDGGARGVGEQDPAVLEHGLDRLLGWMVEDNAVQLGEALRKLAHHGFGGDRMRPDHDRALGDLPRTYDGSLHPVEDVRAAKRCIARVLPDDEDMASGLPVWIELQAKLTRQPLPTVRRAVPIVEIGIILEKAVQADAIVAVIVGIAIPAHPQQFARVGGDHRATMTWRPERRRLDEDEVTLMLGEDVLANALCPGPLGGRAAAQHHGNVAWLVAR